MKFINYLKDIAGVDVYPLFSLVLFVAFFAVVALYAFTASKKSMDERAHLPLED
jgi:cbb3-type cytochrome oxidase subunit 3